MTRGIEIRLAKLEGKRRVDDEVMLVWRRRGTDAQASVDAYQHLIAKGDPVMCAEWLGEGEPPAPRWHRDFPKGLTDIEDKYLHTGLKSRRADRERWAIRKFLATKSEPSILNYLSGDWVSDPMLVIKLATFCNDVYVQKRGMHYTRGHSS
jgi:hypothetical protein